MDDACFAGNAACFARFEPGFAGVEEFSQLNSQFLTLVAVLTLSLDEDQPALFEITVLGTLGPTAWCQTSDFASTIQHH